MVSVWVWVRATPMTWWPGFLHQAFEIHRNEGLVLDDQHVGGDLRRHFASGGIGELAGLGDIDRQDERHPGARREIRKVCVQNAPAPPAPGHSDASVLSFSVYSVAIELLCTYSIISRELSTACVNAAMFEVLVCVLNSVS